MVKPPAINGIIFLCRLGVSQSRGIPARDPIAAYLASQSAIVVRRAWLPPPPAASRPPSPARGEGRCPLQGNPPPLAGDRHPIPTGTTYPLSPPRERAGVRGLLQTPPEVNKPLTPPTSPAWLTAGMVNAESHIFRPPLFTNLFAFLVEFYDSKIRLNIFARAQLTKKCTVPRAPCALRHARIFPAISMPYNGTRRVLIWRKELSRTIAPSKKNRGESACTRCEFTYSARTVRFEAERKRQAIPGRDACRGAQAPLFPCLSSA